MDINPERLDFSKHSVEKIVSLGKLPGTPVTKSIAPMKFLVHWIIFKNHW